jgi:hypothetical protein
MAQQGQAAGYYDDRNTYQEYQAPQGPPPAQEYQSPPPPQPSNGQLYVGGPPAPNNGQQYGAPQQEYEQKYGQQPPTYGEAFNPPQHSDQDFKDTFKITKPKWNDLWAGLLVCDCDNPSPAHGY